MLESHFDKVAGPQACNFIKKRLQHDRFPVKFAKSLKNTFLQNTSGGWPLDVFCKDFVDISYENALSRILEALLLWLYAFFNYSCILVREILFLNQRGLSKLTTSCIS